MSRSRWQNASPLSPKKKQEETRKIIEKKNTEEDEEEDEEEEEEEERSEWKEVARIKENREEGTTRKPLWAVRGAATGNRPTGNNRQRVNHPSKAKKNETKKKPGNENPVKNNGTSAAAGPTINTLKKKENS